MMKKNNYWWIVGIGTLIFLIFNLYLSDIVFFQQLISDIKTNSFYLYLGGIGCVLMMMFYYSFYNKNRKFKSAEEKEKRSTGKILVGLIMLGFTFIPGVLLLGDDKWPVMGGISMGVGIWFSSILIVGIADRFFLPFKENLDKISQ